MRKKRENQPDWFLLATCSILILLGLLILLSVSAFFAQKYSLSPYHFLLRQIFLGILGGGFLGFLAFKISLEKIKKITFFLFILNLLLTSLVFFPFLGKEKGGAKRWVKIKNISFQPSEFLKITLPLYLAAWLSQRPNFKKKFKSSRRKKIFLSLTQTFFPFLLILTPLSLLLIFQPDISTLGIILAGAVLIYFAHKTPLWHTFLILILIGGMFFLLLKTSYRAQRLLVFLHPEISPLGEGYQIKQALIAIGSGGILGRGFGFSRQKLGFLPQPLSDSIFAILGEEAGFLGSFLLVSLFLIFWWRSFKIAQEAKDSFLKLVALGLSSQILLQAFLNISALIRLVPLTGIPLPFVSYGSSHLASEMIILGILLNISKNKKI